MTGSEPDERKTLEISVEGLVEDKETFHSILNVEKYGNQLHFKGIDSFGKEWEVSDRDHFGAYSRCARNILEGDSPVDGFVTDFFDYDSLILFRRDLSKIIGAMEMQRSHQRYETIFLMQPVSSAIRLYVLCQRLIGEPGVTYSLRINDGEHVQPYPITVREFVNITE